MDKNEFVEGLKEASEKLDKEQILKIINKSIESNLYDGNPRGHRNLIIVMEELAELAQKISKCLRDKQDLVGLVEELADVQLGIFCVQEIFKIDDDKLNQAINVKMNRVHNRLLEKGVYK